MPRQTAPTLDRPWHRPGRFRYALTRLHRFARPLVTVTQPPDNLVIDRDAEVRTRDGTSLRVNVFRAPGDTRRPVDLCAHPYGKDNTYSPQNHMLCQPGPVEAPDPAWWVERAKRRNGRWPERIGGSCIWPVPARYRWNLT